MTCRMGVHTILAVQYSVDLQYSSQIVETGAFVLNFLQISYIHASHLCSHSNVPLSFPNVEQSVFWSTEMTANPNQHLGGKNQEGEGEGEKLTLSPKPPSYPLPLSMPATQAKSDMSHGCSYYTGCPV